VIAQPRAQRPPRRCAPCEREHDAGGVEAHGGSGSTCSSARRSSASSCRLVLDLEEPYRTVILLRYFEERSPTAIAREQGFPSPP
jgi:hypothetical protein